MPQYSFQNPISVLNQINYFEYIQYHHYQKMGSFNYDIFRFLLLNNLDSSQIKL